LITLTSKPAQMTRTSRDRDRDQQPTTMRLKAKKVVSKP